MLSLALIVAASYLVLLAAYFATCLIVLRLNGGAVKIQTREEKSERIARDRRQSLMSLFTIACLFGTGQWMYWHLGWGWHPPALPLPWTIAWWAGSFLLSMVLFDSWFYWFHRLLHTRWLYPAIHRWHHLTVTPQVWSNNSDLVADNLFLQSYWLVAHFLFPVSPWVLVAHKLYDQITGVAGHSGYEHGGKMGLLPSPLLAVTHHDQHHRFMRCNYATHFSLWDRLMGTLHGDHDAEIRRHLARAGAHADAVTEKA